MHTICVASVKVIYIHSSQWNEVADEAGVVTLPQAQFKAAS